jgi:glycosyltransferase involved in cell wall biosynthesis
VILGVRQNSVELYRARVFGWPRIPSLAAVHVVDAFYRLLGRFVPVTVQGTELADRYGNRANVLELAESIVRGEDVLSSPLERDWSGELGLLTVGRIEPEKNPALLVEAIARLEREEQGRYRLGWVGRGPLEDDTRRRVAEAGLLERIEFLGYVPFEAGLLDLYRRAHIFVHISLSEGVPKVLIEALASATPIVATDVGGVRALLDNGRAGILVPPDDVESLVRGVQKIARDSEFRAELIARGLRLAATLTMEAQAERVVGFIASAETRNRALRGSSMGHH